MKWLIQMYSYLLLLAFQIRNTISQMSFLNQKKVLITDKVHSILKDGLRDIGIQVEYDTSIQQQEFERKLFQFTGVIINSKIRITRKLIKQNPQLEFIARLGSGLEIIDVDAAKEYGISVINSPEGNRDAVAEHAIGMLLCLLNKINIADREVRNMIWEREKNRGIELGGKTVGIIGFGNTGRAFAGKLLNWGVRLLAYDKYDESWVNDFRSVKKVDLSDICNEADVISLHVPLTHETRHLVNEEFLNKCNKKIVLINTSRGEVVNTRDLLKFLIEGKILGACLDVFENEKVATFSEDEEKMYKKLYELENVILTPHIAGWTKESLEKIALVTLTKIKNLFQTTKNQNMLG